MYTWSVSSLSLLNCVVLGPRIHACAIIHVDPC